MDQIQPRSVNIEGEIDKKQPRKRAKKEKKSRPKDDHQTQKQPITDTNQDEKPDQKQPEKRKRRKKGNEDQEDQRPKEKNVSKDKGGKSKRGKCGQNDLEVVAQYMLKQNRPYSLINIYDNLHGQIKKPALEGVLEELCSEKRATLVLKNYNKFIIYFYNQNLLQKPSQEQLKRMNLEFTSVSQKVSALQSQLRQSNSLLAKILSRPTLPALKSQLEEIKEEVLRKEKSLEFYHSKQFVPADSKEVQRVNKLVQTKERALKQRRGAVLSALSSLAEGMQRKSKQLGQEIGLDFQQPN